MDPVLDRIRGYIDQHQLLQESERVIVGLSGGVDSVVLAHALLELGYSPVAVHVNFQLRGEASEGDEAFVRQWCEDCGVALETLTFDTEHIAAKRGQSIQEAARELRYKSFRDCAQQEGIGKVALGHHRDDQAETILLNLFRGTGLEGLAGMPVRRPLSDDVEVIRPLLSLSRRQIEAYAERHGLTWREDATNVKPAYRRGALRAQILPLIEQHFGRSVRERLARTAGLVRAYLDAGLDEHISDAFHTAADSVDGEGALRLDALDAMPEVIRRRVIIEALRRWLPEVEASAHAAEEIDQLRTSQVGKRRKYGGAVVWRERDILLFRAESSSDEGGEVMLEIGSAVELQDGTLSVERLDRPPKRLDSGNPNEALIDARSVSLPLRVRTWEEGDRFSPLGMDRSKKLSDFLTDERVPPHRKKDVFVVVSAGRIVWVVGHRIAHEVRVTGDTTQTLRLSYHPAENQGDL